MNKNKELVENGWALEQHQLPHQIMERLINKKDYFLEIAEAEVFKEFGVKFTVFEESKKEFIELTKAITRSLLRYDSDSIELAKHIYKILKNEFDLGSEINYCTLPYPIIHYPNDTSEIGTKHKDGYNYINNFYTTWTPLNDCFSQPLSISEKTHLPDSMVIRALRSRVKLVDLAINSLKKIVKPDVKIGEFAMWYGATDHEGLLNKTNVVTMALVVRFTSEPIMFDSTISVSALQSFIPQQTSIDVPSFIKKCIMIFNEVIKESSNALKTDVDFPATLQSVKDRILSWNLSLVEAKQVSFMLTLWGQRLESKKDVSFFYLYSICCSAISLLALDKFLNQLIKKNEINSAQQFINFIAEYQSSIQSLQTVKNVLARFSDIGNKLSVNYESNPPLLKW